MPGTGTPAAPSSSSEPVNSITIVQPVFAPPERVWRACTEAQGLRAWQADEVLGSVADGARVVLGWPALGVDIPLEVELVVPLRQLAFRTGDARVELHFGAGQVTLVHSDDFAEDEREGTLSSWRLSLATLAHYLEHHDGQPRSVHWAVARAKVSLEDAHAFFTLPGAQSGWLSRGDGTGIGEAGSAVALDLAWGAPLSGRVLAHSPPRDALISWRETNQSVLALRTLPCPDASAERLLIATWSSWGVSNAEAIAAQLQAALQRLARILERRVSA